MKILSVVGARPNFMKVAPVIKALQARPGRAQHYLVHTGQHYDEDMSGAFFDALRMPEPDFNLGVERPITVTEGTNRIAGTSHAGILGAVAGALSGPARKDGRPEKWDGKAAERIVETILTSSHVTA